MTTRYRTREGYVGIPSCWTAWTFSGRFYFRRRGGVHWLTREGQRRPSAIFVAPQKRQVAA